VPLAPWLTALSFAAGGINALSTAPQVLATLRQQEWSVSTGTSRRDGRRLRNAAQLVGSGLWMVFGSFTGNWAIVLFCGLNACLVGYLLARDILASRTCEARGLRCPTGQTSPVP